MYSFGYSLAQMLVLQNIESTMPNHWPNIATIMNVFYLQKAAQKAPNFDHLVEEDNFKLFNIDVLKAWSIFL